MEHENQKIQFDEPMGIMGVVSAGMADLFGALFMAGIALISFGGLGLVFGFVGASIHYVGVFFVYIFFKKKFRGVLTWVVVGLLWLLPAPTLLISIVVGRALSHKVVRLVAEQVAIQAVAAVTGGAGEVLEGAVIAGRTAEAGATIGRAAKAGGAIGRAVKTGGAAQRAAGTGERAAKLTRGEQTLSREAEATKKVFEKMEDLSDQGEDGESEEGPQEIYDASDEASEGVVDLSQRG